MKSADVVWDDKTLAEWLKDPQHFIPGNTMLFAGVPNVQQRADLLAFLKDATRPGNPPSTPAQSGQMGGMMGDGAIPNLKKLDPGIACRRLITAAIPTRSPRPMDIHVTLGNAMFGSRRT
jgi:hypothetical protein